MIGNQGISHALGFSSFVGYSSLPSNARNADSKAPSKTAITQYPGRLLFLPKIKQERPTELFYSRQGALCMKLGIQPVLYSGYHCTTEGSGCQDRFKVAHKYHAAISGANACLFIVYLIASIAAFSMGSAL
jgi:hypothetical protein